MGSYLYCYKSKEKEPEPEPKNNNFNSNNINGSSTGQSKNEIENRVLEIDQNPNNKYKENNDINQMKVKESAGSYIQ